MAKRPTRLLVVGALAALAAGAGCAEVERFEKPVSLILETDPPGAIVAVTASDEAKPKLLGEAPSERTGLFVVSKRYPSGVVDYWLLDKTSTLPPNPDKPSFASPLYSAGNDYPFTLTFVAALPGRKPATSHIVIDRARLREMFESSNPSLRIELLLDEVPKIEPEPEPEPPAPEPAPPANGGTTEPAGSEGASGGTGASTPAPGASGAAAAGGPVEAGGPGDLEPRVESTSPPAGGTGTAPPAGAAGPAGAGSTPEAPDDAGGSPGPVEPAPAPGSGSSPDGGGASPPPEGSGGS